MLAAAAYSIAHMFTGNHHLRALSVQDALLLASVLSASDEVSAMSIVRMKEFPRLGALIFGEGVINDAMSIVIFKALIDFHSNETEETNESSMGLKMASKLTSVVLMQLVMACFIGLTTGLVNARILRLWPALRQHPVHQSSLVLLFGYLAYFIAEAFDVSGILTLFVAAITIAHYSWHSLSKTSQLATKISFQSLSDIAEAFTFCYVGLSLWAFTTENYSFGYAIIMLLVVVFSRFAITLLLCWICSYFGKEILPFGEQCGLAAGGVVRGCLCWAQVLQIGGHELLVTTTLVVVMVTTVGGGFLLPILMPSLVSPVAAKNNKDKNKYTTINNGDRGTAAADFPNNFGADQQPLRFGEKAFEKLTINTSPMRRRASGRPGELDESTYSKYMENSDFEDSEDIMTPMSDDIEAQDTAQIGSTYAVLYILWIRFDETIMKPIFGGSRADETRSFLLYETKAMSMYNILSASNQMKEIVRVGVELPTSRSPPRSPMRMNNVEKDLPLSSVKVSKEAKLHRQTLGSSGRGLGIGSRDTNDDELFLKDECSIIDVSSPIAPLSFDSLPANARLALDVTKRPNSNEGIGNDKKHAIMNEKSTLLIGRK